MMGIVVPKTCWARNKICNKNHLSHPVGVLFPHINDDAGQNQIKWFSMNFCTWAENQNLPYGANKI
jgi:hypothetical protein